MPKRRDRQKGAALLLFAAIFVLGSLWFVLNGLGKVGPDIADREVKTGLALQAAKQALLGYMAQYAARTTGAGSNEPGQMPCPELLTAVGGASEGIAAPSCSNAVAEIGRLPWRTLGVDPIRDGDGELLWYALSPGFRSSPINFDTAGQIPFDGSTVVAVIIAPGRPVNNTSDPATPPAGSGCSKVNQQGARYASPLDPAKFFECGNAGGNYRNHGTSQWTNDRALTITTAEWIAAVAPAIQDRLQRQVAPRLSEWLATDSPAIWGQRFLPYASPFSDPAANSICGSNGTRVGLMPLTKAAASTCTSWTSGSVQDLLGSLLSLGCTQVAGNRYECRFLNTSLAPLSVRIRARAPNVGGAFRSKITDADINPGGGTVSSFSLSLDTGDSHAYLDFRVAYGVLSFLALVTVSFPNLPDAPILSDASFTWFVDNQWMRHTYYGLARANRLSGGGLCPDATNSNANCLTVNSLPAGSGEATAKQLVVALMGPALTAISQSRPSGSLADYLESRVDPSDSTPSAFNAKTMAPTYNDRFATCPFQYSDSALNPLVVACN